MICTKILCAGPYINLLCSQKNTLVALFNYLGQEIYEPSYCYFPESRKKSSKFLFLFYLNIFCFVEKNNMFLRFCLCIFESDTVQSDCPMQENYEIFKEIYEIFKDLIQTVGLLY